MNNHPVIVIAGCTASGKSDIAIKVAKEIGGVIINADSRQVYKEISIGTAKPQPDKVKDGIYYIEGIKHYLYSYVSIREKYNLYRYQKDALKILKELEDNEIPILVGGTGLYIDSVVFNYKLQEGIENKTEYRNLENFTVPQLQKLLTPKQLSELNESDRSNPRRLLRILEKGKRNVEKGPMLNHLYFYIDTDKDILKKRISKRVKKMLDRGLIVENRKILEEGLNKYRALDTIGYREFDGYFEGRKSIEKVEEDIVTHTNQYAKRQRVWFKRNKNRIKVKSHKEIVKVINENIANVQ